MISYPYIPNGSAYECLFQTFKTSVFLEQKHRLKDISNFLQKVDTFHELEYLMNFP